MRKILAVSTVLIGLVFLTGCSLRLMNRDQPTTSTPSIQAPITNSSSQQNKNSCPEWINCFPELGRNNDCKIPKGCEGITQIAR